MRKKTERKIMEKMVGLGSVNKTKTGPGTDIYTYVQRKYSYVYSLTLCSTIQFVASNTVTTVKLYLHYWLPHEKVLERQEHETSTEMRHQ